MVWLIVAAYFVIGMSLAIWMARDGEDEGYVAFVFFCWGLMAAAGIFMAALIAVFIAPAKCAAFIASLFKSETAA